MEELPELRVPVDVDPIAEWMPVPGDCRYALAVELGRLEGEP